MEFFPATNSFTFLLLSLYSRTFYFFN